MKQSFISIMASAMLVLGAFDASWADAARGAKPHFASVNEELKQRFLAAVARSREPMEGFSEWQRLLALQSVEKGTGLNVGVSRMMADAVEKDPGLKSAFHLVQPGGIRQLSYDYKKLNFEEAAKKIKSQLKFNNTQVKDGAQPSAPEMGLLGFTILASNAIDQCRADEAETNRAFLNHMVAQPFAKLNGELALGALALRMFKHGCISKAEFNGVMQPILPAIRQRLSAEKATPGNLAGIYFLLAEADQLKTVSDAQLIHFVRTQSEDGAWADQSMKSDAPASAAFGALVISHMLRTRGIKVGNQEITMAFKKPPVLPASSFQTPAL